jgi:hypothetical protein
MEVFETLVNWSSRFADYVIQKYAMRRRPYLSRRAAVTCWFCTTEKFCTSLQ